MPFDPLATQIFTRANWPSRRESPEQIAGRLRRFLDDIIAIDESVQAWSVGRRREVPYVSVRGDLAALVRGDLMRDEMGDEEANAGYAISGMSEDRRQLFSFGGAVGGIYPWPSWNRFRFYTNSGRTPDPTIVNYRFVKAVTLATIAAWEPLFCLTGCSDMRPTQEDGWYYKAWVTYVPPVHAEGLDLVGVPFSERTPDSGLLLSATEDVFDASKPAHVDGARRIQEAVRPLNATLPSLL